MWLQAEASGVHDGIGGLEAPQSYLQQVLRSFHPWGKYGGCLPVIADLAISTRINYSYGTAENELTQSSITRSTQCRGHASGVGTSRCRCRRLIFGQSVVDWCHLEGHFIACA